MFESENEVMSANEVADALHVGLIVSSKKTNYLLFEPALEAGISHVLHWNSI